MTAPLLVVAHEATRTGSPKVLLELLRYAVPRLEVPIAIRLLAEGGLAADLRSLATAPDDGSAQAVVVNGALATHVLADVGEIPSLVYVHEEGDALNFLGAADVDALVERASVVLCVSEASRRGVIELGVDEHRVAILPPLVSAVTPPAPEAVVAVRTAIGLGAGDHLVIGCGEAGWRKGADLFVATARCIADRRAAQFAWIGRRGRGLNRVLVHDTLASGLAERFHWIDEVADVLPYLAAADVLLMTSREDPQPLVPLEAAWVGTPTAGFEIGGLADLGRAGGASVVGYPDVAGLASAAIDLLDTTTDGAALTAACRARAVDRQAVGVVGPIFEDACRRLLEAAAGVRS